MEARLQQFQQPQSWTPERLQQELSKPDFIEAAKTVQQRTAPQGWEGTESDWSALSPQEKQQFNELRQEVQGLRQQQFQQVQAQEDEKLKSKYPDYEPTIVSTAIKELYEGKRIATREDIWKVINHDRNVQKAYELGLQDRKLTIQEKQAGSTGMGISTQTQEDRPVQREGEKHGDYLKRTLHWNLENLKKQKQ